ncbi:MAG TPA: alpha/beta fold hydrolase [Gemmatimonadales bacterium]|nr:alpha/beta fold hydrolase [Gemmatimonadales bacterium]
MPSVRSHDGTALAFERRGAGPPLILVDGALCHRAMGPGTPLARLLAREFTVFSYDRRGRGESTNHRPYAVEREIEDLRAVIGVAGGSVRVWGMSSGAALALETARAGGSIAKLALYEPPFIVDASRPPIPADIVAQLTTLVEDDRRGDAVRLFLRHMGAPAIAIAVMRLLPLWRKLTAIAHTLPYDMSIVSPYQAGTPLPDGRWKDVRIPTLVMVGGKSPAWFHHGTLALADALPLATHRVVHGQTHNVRPRSLARPLTEFFNSQGR